MIISLMLFTAISYSNLQAQSISSLRSKVERLERKVERQKEKVEEQKEKVEEAQQKVQEKIEEDKKEAEDNPQAHGTNSELQELREELNEEQEKLEELEEKLEELEEELKEAKEKLEEKLKEAVNDILERHPIPDDPDELEEYEEKMKKLETNPRNSETEAELRKRIQERIDAKRKELEEHGALPGQQNQGFGSNDSNWERIGIEEEPSRHQWTIGGYYAAWFSKGEEYPDTYFEDIKKEVYTNAELTEQLMEKLGGEFHIGSFSAPSSFTNHQYKIPQLFGLNGYFWFNRRLGFEAGIGKGKSSTSAEFPVTVFDFENGMTSTTFGKLDYNRDFLTTFVHMQYLFYIEYLRVVFGVGVDYQKYAPSTLEATLENQRFTVNNFDATSNISPSAQLGLQLKVSKRIFLEAKMNTKLEEKKLEAGVQLGIQIQVSK